MPHSVARPRHLQAPATLMSMSASATLISGTAIAAAITDELTAEVTALRGDGGDSAPGLAVVLVGDRKDSATYVRNKKKACEKIGIRSIGHDLPADVSETELLALIRALNADPLVHGILVQVRVCLSSSAGCVSF